MPTQCRQDSFDFGTVAGRQVVGAFDGGAITSNAGALLLGAADKAREAGICIIGGHTIKDKEPKFGLSVTGRVHPDRMWHNRGAKPGDAIVLTKPLGTGVATSAIKWGICPKGTEEAVIASMARLNANASKAGRGVGISTATDVTGFGLIGHLLEVLEGSGLAAEIRLADVPVFDGVRDLMKRKRVDALTGRRRFPGSEWIHATFGGHPIPGGTHQNMGHQLGRVRFPPMLPAEEAYLLSDPQTSGGLLMFVPEASAGALCDALRAAGEGAWRIGRTVGAGGIDMQRITVI